MKHTKDNMDNEFKIRPMSKKELAVAYAPGLTIKSATNRLAVWLQTCSHLMEELRATGYQKSQRLLTARQVEIIVRHLGEP